MTTLANRPNTAVLVVDVQKGVVAGAHERDAVVANIGSLVEKARGTASRSSGSSTPTTGLVRGSDDWQIVPELSPREDEPQIDKHYGDSFEATPLETVLADLGVGRLLVAGAETDACVRSTLHGAFVRGYDTTLVSDAHTTSDLTNGARRRPTRSSPTRTCTGPTRGAGPDGRDGRDQGRRLRRGQRLAASSGPRSSADPRLGPWASAGTTRAATVARHGTRRPARPTPAARGRPSAGRSPRGRMAARARRTATWSRHRSPRARAPAAPNGRRRQWQQRSERRERRPEDDAGQLARDRRGVDRPVGRQHRGHVRVERVDIGRQQRVRHPEQPPDGQGLGVEARRARVARQRLRATRRPTASVESTSVAWTHSESSGSRAVRDRRSAAAVRTSRDGAPFSRRISARAGVASPYTIAGSCAASRPAGATGPPGSRSAGRRPPRPADARSGAAAPVGRHRAGASPRG